MSSLPARWLEVLDSLSLRERVAGGRERGNDSHAVTQLTQHIYERHFARWTAGPSAPAPFASGDPVFVEQAVGCAARASLWEPGWELIQDEGEWCFVHSGRMRLLVRREGELWPARARVGAKVAVAMPCLREGLMASFLYWFSRKGPIDPGAPHLRVYLNANPTEGLALLEALLNHRAFEKLRFEAKMPNDPAAFTRCDAVVVYADARDAKPMLEALRRYRRTRRRGWGRETPFAAWTVEPGIAIAESPPLSAGEARSFGLHRSRLVAEAFLGAKRAGQGDALERLLRALKRERIDVRTPHGQRLPLSFWKKLGPL